MQSLVIRGGLVHCAYLLRDFDPQYVSTHTLRQTFQALCCKRQTCLLIPDGRDACLIVDLIVVA